MVSRTILRTSIRSSSPLSLSLCLKELDPRFPLRLHNWGRLSQKAFGGDASTPSERFEQNNNNKNTLGKVFKKYIKTPSKMKIFKNRPVNAHVGQLKMGSKVANLWQSISPWILTQKFPNFPKVTSTPKKSKSKHLKGRSVPRVSHVFWSQRILLFSRF